jgi:hypothetical protein
MEAREFAEKLRQYGHGLGVDRDNAPGSHTMAGRIASVLLASCAAFAAALLPGTPVAASEPAGPPEIPGKAYIRFQDGCGMLVPVDPAKPEDIEASRAFWGDQHWLGECRHGLANGYGYTLHREWGFSADTYVLGELKSARYSARPSAMTLSGGAVMTYARHDETFSRFDLMSVPMAWNEAEAFEPEFATNNGSSYDDAGFTWQDSEGTSGRVTAEERSCILVDEKLRGCRRVEDQYNVYGVHLTRTGGGGPSLDEFTLCPDPRSPVGCEALWRRIAGPQIERALAFIGDVRRGMALEQQQLTGGYAAAEQALPQEWKGWWAARPDARLAGDVALRCFQASDFHPVNVLDAERIQAKYAAEPCRTASTAALALATARDFVRSDADGRAEYDGKMEAYAQERARRAARNAELWGQFFNNASAMAGAYVSMHAPVPAPAASSGMAAMPMPAYQSYGQPPASASAPASSGQSHTRAIHRPELDAQSCVSLVQLSEGEPLTSFGSQVFANRCGETVEVFWCKVGDECERGAGGMTTVGAGRSWPVTGGHYRWGACKGANSGGLVKEASGQFTGRYACTGP